MYTISKSQLNFEVRKAFSNLNSDPDVWLFRTYSNDDVVFKAITRGNRKHAGYVFYVWKKIENKYYKYGQEFGLIELSSDDIVNIIREKMKFALSSLKTEINKLETV